MPIMKKNTKKERSLREIPNKINTTAFLNSVEVEIQVLKAPRSLKELISM